jgi:hypothetical protein
MYDAFVAASKTDAPAINKALRLFWKHWVPAGMTLILSIGVATLATGVQTVREFDAYSNPWYVAVAGVLFGLGHFAYGGAAMNLMEKLRDEKVEKEGKTVDWQREWLRVHRIRTVTTDIPAVLCFAYLVFGLEE